jgi:hypothetical protein
MKLRIIYILAIFILQIFFISCTSKKDESGNRMENANRTFGDDLEFLQKYGEVVVLKDGSGKAQVIVSPQLQAKVMTSTARGLEGKSFGWINYDLLASGKISKHINAYGGEDRVWLGPEGGQFSIFFAPEAEMTIDNWFTPKEIDTEPFQLVAQSESSITMKSSMTLSNYSKTYFFAEINREVILLSKDDMSKRLDIDLRAVNSVAYESINKLKNVGKDPWTREGGTLCIWILGMFTPSDQVVVVIPFEDGPEDKLGPILTSDYFGEVPADRLQIKDNCIFFKADGKYRSKLGVAASRAKGIAGSYDQLNNVLTIIQYSKPSGNPDYINQLWEIQDEPFKGDVLNTYNDGPMEDGSQMGPFYELESSSPAAFLDAGEEITHQHATFHFVGTKEQLDPISKKVLGVSLEKISSVFK